MLPIPIIPSSRKCFPEVCCAVMPLPWEHGQMSTGSGLPSSLWHFKTICLGLVMPLVGWTPSPLTIKTVPHSLAGRTGHSHLGSSAIGTFSQMSESCVNCHSLTIGQWLEKTLWVVRQGVHNTMGPWMVVRVTAKERSRKPSGIWETASSSWDGKPVWTSPWDCQLKPRMWRSM